MKKFVNEVLKTASERNGVVLCLNEKILDHKIEEDPEMYAVRVYLPDGLPMEYIDRIVPQSEYEMEKIKNFVKNIEF